MAPGLIQCPACHGQKKCIAHLNTGPDSSKHRWVELPCFTCAGEGKIHEEQLMRIEQGEAMRQARLARSETLYDAATRMGLRPSQLSAIEHGRGAPEDYPETPR